MEKRDLEKLLDAEGKEFKAKIIELIKGDEDFYNFMLWGFVVGYNKLQMDMEVKRSFEKKGTYKEEDGIYNAFMNIEKWEKGHLFNKVSYMTSLL